MKVVLASKNPHKLVEISKITEKFGFELVLQSYCIYVCNRQEEACNQLYGI